MMTDEEVQAFLAEIIKIDNRKLSAALVLTWKDAAHFGRWTYREAMEALHWHTLNSTDWLMPAHVNLRIKDQRQIPAPVAEVARIERTAPAGSDHIKTVLAELTEQMGWDVRQTSHNDPELDIPCPHPPCTAGRRAPCRKHWTHGRHKDTYTELDTYHESRTKAAKTKAASETK